MIIISKDKGMRIQSRHHPLHISPRTDDHIGRNSESSAWLVDTDIGSDAAGSIIDSLIIGTVKVDDGCRISPLRPVRRSRYHVGPCWYVELSIHEFPLCLDEIVRQGGSAGNRNIVINAVMVGFVDLDIVIGRTARRKYGIRKRSARKDDLAVSVIKRPVISPVAVDADSLPVAIKDSARCDGEIIADRAR